MHSCEACWPDLLDALASEGLDLRDFASVRHLVLVPEEAPDPLAPFFGVN